MIRKGAGTNVRSRVAVWRAAGAASFLKSENVIFLAGTAAVGESVLVDWLWKATVASVAISTAIIVGPLNRINLIS